MDRLNLSYRRFILAAIVAVVVAAVATVLTVKLSGPVAAADGGLREFRLTLFGCLQASGQRTSIAWWPNPRVRCGITGPICTALAPSGQKTG